jgi:hypothetical protein
MIGRKSVLILNSSNRFLRNIRKIQITLLYGFALSAIKKM